MVRTITWFQALCLLGTVCTGAVPKPTIDSFNPTAVNVGTFTVTITGTNFVPGSVVSLSGVPVATKVLSATQLTFTATVPTPEDKTVTIANPAPNAATSSGRTFKVLPPISLNAHPEKANVRAGTTYKLSVSVYNAVDHTIAWSVLGGTVNGTVDADGNYTAPAVVPNPNLVQVQVQSMKDPNAKDTVPLTILNPTPTITSTLPAKLAPADPAAFVINGTGFLSTSVVKLDGAVVPFAYMSPTQLKVSTKVTPAPGGVITLTVSNPDPGPSTSKVAYLSVGIANPKVSLLAASRFLEQASWGPNADSVAELQQLGFDAWLQAQYDAPQSMYAATESQGIDRIQSQFFTYARTGTDQLRQRVAFALSQIFVVSALKTPKASQMQSYLNMLGRDAFSTYPTLLKDVTLSPTMGVYLDMVNNDKADPTKDLQPNENYGREVLQLFSIGTALLNIDGTTQKDAFGQPLPTYTQSNILDMSRAFTGWTYPSSKGAPVKGHNPENYNGPMVPVQVNHDMGAKTLLLGKFLPPGQTAEQDLDAALANISTHPNVAPFISLRLIEQLVTSNPSAGYITRVANTFNSTHGDMKAVIRAILLDTEARLGDTATALPSNSGKLREPLLFLNGMLRNLEASVIANNPLEGAGSDMGQKLYYSPSVFNYFSPLYRLANGLQAPEFQILSPATALARANVVNSLVYTGLDGDAKLNLGPFTRLTDNPDILLDALNTAFFYGKMPAEMRASIQKTIAVTTDRGDKVRTAIYLICTSPLYQVEH